MLVVHKSGGLEMRPLNEIIVHCTATQPKWMANNTATDKVAEIRRWHTDRGWSDIGYSYIIDRDGTVAEGRPLERIGAHVKGHNTGSVGIALVGGHGSSEHDPFGANYTVDQDRALRKLIDDLKAKYPSIKKVTGHNQYAAKACPGFQVARWLDNKPERTLAQSTTLQATGVTAVGTVGAAGTAIGALDDMAQLIVVGGAVVALLGLAWIARERIKAWASGRK